MANRTGTGRTMPDVPDPDFVGSLIEIWFGINCAAYHMAYVRVYLQSTALRTDVEVGRPQEQSVGEQMQVDLVICRSHVAAFFWQLDHIFAALHASITRGQKEHSGLRYFWQWEQELKKIEDNPIRKEISAYRNKGHDWPAIIGQAWDGKGGKFLHHFLPTIEGHNPKESSDMMAELQRYFEFVTNVWFSFAPGDFKTKFPRDFKFPVTVPFSFIGELPPELAGAPQLEISIVSVGEPEIPPKD